MNARLTALETRFDTVLPTLATKADIESVKGEVNRVDASIKTWMLGTILTVIGTMLAAIFGVAQVFKGATQTPPAQPAPIIVQAPPITITPQLQTPGPAAAPAEKSGK